MMFVDDVTVFLADFGAQCSAKGVQFKAIFDQPDDLVGFSGADVVSRSYAITYLTSAVSLAKEDTVIVDGQSFKVRQPPQMQDDGATTQALLKK